MKLITKPRGKGRGIDEPLTAFISEQCGESSRQRRAPRAPWVRKYGNYLCEKFWLWAPYDLPPLHVFLCDQYHVTISWAQV